MPIKRAAKAAPEQDPAVTRALADLAETLGVGPIATLDRTKRLTELVTLDRELTPEEDAELAAEAKRRADRRRAAREGEKRRAKWIRKHGPLVTVDDNLAYLTYQLKGGKKAQAREAVKPTPYVTPRPAGRRPATLTKAALPEPAKPDPRKPRRGPSVGFVGYLDLNNTDD